MKNNIRMKRVNIYLHKGNAPEEEKLRLGKIVLIARYIEKDSEVFRVLMASLANSISFCGTSDMFSEEEVTIHVLDFVEGEEFNKLLS